jgi:hypothetical protein
MRRRRSTRASTISPTTARSSRARGDSVVAMTHSAADLRHQSGIRPGQRRIVDNPRMPRLGRNRRKIRAGRRGFRPALVPCTKSVLQSHAGSCHSKTTTVRALYNDQITATRGFRYLFVTSYESRRWAVRAVAARRRP